MLVNMERDDLGVKNENVARDGRVQDNFLGLEIDKRQGRIPMNLTGHLVQCGSNYGCRTKRKCINFKLYEQHCNMTLNPS